MSSKQLQQHESAGPAPRTPKAENPSRDLATGVVHRLQRTIGNRALGQLLARTSQPSASGLTISHPGDAHELEAERVSDLVMQMPQAAAALAAGTGAGAPSVQRQSDAGAADRTEAPPSVHDVLRSPGLPLDTGTRAFFEPRFGYDFSGVRVHVGTAAARSARDVNALAYTVGHDVVFGEGRFAPGTHHGRRLLAH